MIERDFPFKVRPTINNPCPRENYVPSVPDADVLALIDKLNRQESRIAFLEAALETALAQTEQALVLARAKSAPLHGR